MRFYYPTGVVGGTGFSGLASYMAARIGTVTGQSGVEAPQAPTGNDGYVQAMADALLGVGGPYQARYEAVPIGNLTGQNPAVPTRIGNGTSTGWASLVFVPPMTRTYLIEASFMAFSSAADALYFEVYRNTVTMGAILMHIGVAGYHHQVRVSYVAVLTAGTTYTFEPYWSHTNGAATLDIDGNDHYDLVIR